ncbi:hypothetical protein [Mesorhizobium sp. CAU 1732]|uniref:hypothetical protein n=1 Tax=Mesorhizobium sp. CAU 1732 TaxID=3140358 RepID=UPI003261AD07
MKDMATIATVDQRGCIQLPSRFLRARGWTSEQWFSIEEIAGGLQLSPTTRPAAPDILRTILSASLDALGDEVGERHTRYVSRWRHASGAVVVNENSQPNVWLARNTFEKFDAKAFATTPELFVPGDQKMGFHSNVASTAGLQNKAVVKLRAKSTEETADLATQIIDQLDAL